LNNPDDYIFSSLTASVDGTMKFSPIHSEDAILATVENRLPNWIKYDKEKRKYVLISPKLSEENS